MGGYKHLSGGLTRELAQTSIQHFLLRGMEVCFRLLKHEQIEVRVKLFLFRHWARSDVVRSGASRAEIVDYIESVILKKEPRHFINDPGFVTPSRTMSFIGG